jgi:hypothetical protein
VEPFCGAAQYSLFGDNWKKEVILYDKDPIIAGVWLYLIQANKHDILSLPDVTIGDNLDNYKQLSADERSLMGFYINTASAMPKKTVMKRSIWNRKKIAIADNLYKVAHWSIACKDYRDIPYNTKCTWFIDPPYFDGGKYYRMNNSKINYWDLGEWCKSREGQVIVCENTKADWLPFKPLVEMNGQLHKTMEAVWIKEK